MNTEATYTEREDLESTLWDLYKSVHGIRPRGWDFSKMSLEDLRSTIDNLHIQLAVVIDEEAKQEALCIEKFKGLIKKAIEIGAGDEETALRWLTSEQVFYNELCIEHWVYNQGFLFTDYGKDLVATLKKIVVFQE